MCSAKKGDEAIINGWRNLGFYYEFSEDKGVWKFVGSKKGLLKFSKLLDDYVLDPRNAGISEHEHYGPYLYLKIMTWDKPIIDKNAISGTLLDFKKLSDLIKQKLKSLNALSKFEIDKEYSIENKAKIIFEIKEADFDPSSADPHPYAWKQLENGQWV